jgi:hypothetical protein
MKNVLFSSIFLFSVTNLIFGQNVKGIYYYETPAEQYLHILEVKERHSYKFTSPSYIEKGKWKMSADTLILSSKKHISKIRGVGIFGHKKTKYLFVNGNLNRIHSDSTKKDPVEYSKKFPE